MRNFRSPSLSPLLMNIFCSMIVISAVFILRTRGYSCFLAFWSLTLFCVLLIQSDKELRVDDVELDRLNRNQLHVLNNINLFAERKKSIENNSLPKLQYFCRSMRIHCGSDIRSLKRQHDCNQRALIINFLSGAFSKSFVAHVERVIREWLFDVRALLPSHLHIQLPDIGRFRSVRFSGKERATKMEWKFDVFSIRLRVSSALNTIRNPNAAKRSW